MTHDEARALLTDRLFDELAERPREELEEHLESCAECRKSARDWASAWEALGELEPGSVDGAAAVRFGRRLERERTSGPGRPALRAAAVALLFLTGGLVGHALAPEPVVGPQAPPESERMAAAAEEPRFLLLLRGDEPDRRRPADALAREYGEWASEIARTGALIAAEELEAGSGRWVASGDPSEAESAGISGFFLVAAPSHDSAVAIARRSPHVGYGGVVEVRRIVEAR